MAATKAERQMENMRIEYAYVVDAITLLGGRNAVEEHLRVDLGDVGSNEYNHVLLLGEIAIRYVEQVTGRHVMNKNANVDVHTLHDRLEFPFRAQRLSSFEYTNENHGTTSVVVADAWNIYKETSPTVLEQKLTYSSPTDYALDAPYPFRFGFEVHGDFDILSSSTTQTNRLFIGAALMYLAHLYENREAAGFSAGRPYVMPLAFESIVKTLKRIR